MKRLLSSLLTAALLLSLLSGVCFAAEGRGMDPFKRNGAYKSGTFHDVAAGIWYEEGVATAYELGLIKGDNAGNYNPGVALTLRDAVTLAARLHRIYNTGKDDFVQGNPWYQVYIDYAVDKGIIEAAEYNDYSVTATRAQMAHIFAGALPAGELTAINRVTTLPDVGGHDRYADDIFLLYRAGVLTGNDAAGTFEPEGEFTRAQAATLIARMALPELRKTLSLQQVTVPKKEDYLERKLTDAQLAALKNSSPEILRTKISTVADAVAFLDQFTPTFYTSVTENIEIDIDFLLDLHRTEATAGVTYAAITAWCLQDDYPDIQYVFGLVGAPVEIMGYPMVHCGIALPVEGGYTILSPALNTGRDGYCDVRGFYEVTVSDLAQLRDVLRPLHTGMWDDSTLYTLYLCTADAGQEKITFVYGDNKIVPTQGSATERFQITDEELQKILDDARQEQAKISWENLMRNWDSYGLSESMMPTLSKEQVENLVGKDIDTVANALKTLGDCLYYYALSGYTGSSGDLQTRDNSVGQGNNFWHYNYAPQAVFYMNTGNCGGSSGLTAYFLQGDYPTVGMLTMTFVEGAGGGHYINYLYDGRNYYVFDIVNLVSAFHQSGFCFSTGGTLLAAVNTWCGKSGYPVRLMCAFQSFDGDIPIGWDHGNSNITYLPVGYRDTAEILIETPEEGYVYQWVEMNEAIAAAIRSKRDGDYGSPILPEQAPEGIEDPMSRALTDEQLEQLKWADAKTLQAWISTVPDAVAFLDQFEPAVYDALSAMEMLETDVEFALDLHRTEATAPSTYLIFAAWCLADDQPESKYVVSLIENGGQPVLLYSLAVPVVDGYLIISPVVLSQWGSGPYGHEQMVVSELTGLGSQLKPQFVGRTIVCVVLADVMQEGLVFRGGNGGIETTGGTAQEVYRVSDAEKAALEQAEAEAWAKVARTLNVADYGMPAAIGNTTLNYDSAYALVGQDPEVIAKTVKTVGDVLQYMIAARFSYNAPSAYTPWYGNWGFDAPGDVQLKQNYGCCCGGFANTVSYLLRGDYEKVGTLRWVGGGNHTINWVYTGGKYYVFDFTQYCAGGRFNNYGSVVTVLDKLEDFYNAMPETYSYFPKSEVVIMVAFEAAEAMYPSHWGDPPNFTGLTFPTEAKGKITVIYQKDPNRGVYYKDVAGYIPGWSD